MRELSHGVTRAREPPTRSKRCFRKLTPPESPTGRIPSEIDSIRQAVWRLPHGGLQKRLRFERRPKLSFRKESM